MSRVSTGSAVLAAAALLLAGCASGPSAQRPAGLTEAVRALAPIVAARRGTAEPLRPTGDFPGLDPATIAGRSDPMMGAWLPSRQAVAGLVPSGLAQPGHRAWRTADNLQLTLAAGGGVVSTRGFGSDLHASDADATAALIAAGASGSAQRRMVWLDGLYRPQTMQLTCQVAPIGRETLVLNGRRHATLRIEERCSGPEVEFANVYWRDAGGTIRQSIQWLGPDLGQIYLQRLID